MFELSKQPAWNEKRVYLTLLSDTKFPARGPLLAR